MALISLLTSKLDSSSRIPHFDPSRHCPCPTTQYNGLNLCTRHDTPSTNLVVSVTREQSLAIGTPCQADGIGFLGLLALLDVFGFELINLALLLQIENGDGGRSSSAKPVSVGGEDKGVDLISSLERVEVLGLVQIPQHGGTVLTA